MENRNASSSENESSCDEELQKILIDATKWTSGVHSSAIEPLEDSMEGVYNKWSSKIHTNVLYPLEDTRTGESPNWRNCLPTGITKPLGNVTSDSPMDYDICTNSLETSETPSKDHLSCDSTTWQSNLQTQKSDPSKSTRSCECDSSEEELPQDSDHASEQLNSGFSQCPPSPHSSPSLFHFHLILPSVVGKWAVGHKGIGDRSRSQGSRHLVTSPDRHLGSVYLQAKCETMMTSGAKCPWKQWKKRTFLKLEINSVSSIQPWRLCALPNYSKTCIIDIMKWVRQDVNVSHELWIARNKLIDKIKEFEQTGTRRNIDPYSFFTRSKKQVCCPTLDTNVESPLLEEGRFSNIHSSCHLRESMIGETLDDISNPLGNGSFSSSDLETTKLSLNSPQKLEIVDHGAGRRKSDTRMPRLEASANHPLDSTITVQSMEEGEDPRSSKLLLECYEPTTAEGHCSDKTYGAICRREGELGSRGSNEATCVRHDVSRVATELLRAVKISTVFVWTNISDVTTDVSKKSQLTTLFRYVNSEGAVEECFLGFIDVSCDRSARALSEHVFRILSDFKCFDKLVAQTYGGAAVMAERLSCLKEIYGRHFDFPRLRSELTVIYETNQFAVKSFAELHRFLKSADLDEVFTHTYLQGEGRLKLSRWLICLPHLSHKYDMQQRLYHIRALMSSSTDAVPDAVDHRDAAGTEADGSVGDANRVATSIAELLQVTHPKKSTDADSTIPEEVDATALVDVDAANDVVIAAEEVGVLKPLMGNIHSTLTGMKVSCIDESSSSTSSNSSSTDNESNKSIHYTQKKDTLNYLKLGSINSLTENILTKSKKKQQCFFNKTHKKAPSEQLELLHPSTSTCASHFPVHFHKSNAGAVPLNKNSNVLLSNISPTKFSITSSATRQSMLALHSPEITTNTNISDMSQEQENGASSYYGKPAYSSSEEDMRGLSIKAAECREGEIQVKNGGGICASVSIPHSKLTDSDKSVRISLKRKLDVLQSSQTVESISTKEFEHAPDGEKDKSFTSQDNDNAHCEKNEMTLSVQVTCGSRLVGDIRQNFRKNAITLIAKIILIIVFVTFLFFSCKFVFNESWGDVGGSSDIVTCRFLVGEVKLSLHNLDGLSKLSSQIELPRRGTATQFRTICVMQTFSVHVDGLYGKKHNHPRSIGTFNNSTMKALVWIPFPSQSVKNHRMEEMLNLNGVRGGVTFSGQWWWCSEGVSKYWQMIDGIVSSAIEMLSERQIKICGGDEEGIGVSTNHSNFVLDGVGYDVLTNETTVAGVSLLLVFVRGGCVLHHLCFELQASCMFRGYGLIACSVNQLVLPKDNIHCVVCGGYASITYYGARCCDKCRTFFRRIVLEDQKPYFDIVARYNLAVWDRALSCLKIGLKAAPGSGPHMFAEFPAYIAAPLCSFNNPYRDARILGNGIPKHDAFRCGAAVLPVHGRWSHVLGDVLVVLIEVEREAAMAEPATASRRDMILVNTDISPDFWYAGDPSLLTERVYPLFPLRPTPTHSIDNTVQEASNVLKFPACLSDADAAASYNLIQLSNGLSYALSGHAARLLKLALLRTLPYLVSCSWERDWGRYGKESAGVFVMDTSQHSAGVISGKPRKAKIRMAVLVIEPASYRMRVQFSRGSPVAPPIHSGTAPHSPQPPSLALKASLLRAVKKSSFIKRGIPLIFAGCRISAWVVGALELFMLCHSGPSAAILEACKELTGPVGDVGAGAKEAGNTGNCVLGTSAEKSDGSIEDFPSQLKKSMALVKQETSLSMNKSMAGTAQTGKFHQTTQNLRKTHPSDKCTRKDATSTRKPKFSLFCLHMHGSSSPALFGMRTAYRRTKRTDYGGAREIFRTWNFRTFSKQASIDDHSPSFNLVALYRKDFTSVKENWSILQPVHYRDHAILRSKCALTMPNGAGLACTSAESNAKSVVPWPPCQMDVTRVEQRSYIKMAFRAVGNNALPYRIVARWPPCQMDVTRVEQRSYIKMAFRAVGNNDLPYRIVARWPPCQMDVTRVEQRSYIKMAFRAVGNNDLPYRIVARWPPCQMDVTRVEQRSYIKMAFRGWENCQRMSQGTEQSDARQGLSFVLRNDVGRTFFVVWRYVCDNTSYELSQLRKLSVSLCLGKGWILDGLRLKTQISDSPSEQCSGMSDYCREIVHDDEKPNCMRMGSMQVGENLECKPGPNHPQGCKHCFYYRCLNVGLDPVKVVEEASDRRIARLKRTNQMFGDITPILMMDGLHHAYITTFKMTVTVDVTVGLVHFEARLMPLPSRYASSSARPECGLGREGVTVKAILHDTRFRKSLFKVRHSGRYTGYSGTRHGISRLVRPDFVPGLVIGHVLFFVAGSTPAIVPGQSRCIFRAKRRKAVSTNKDQIPLTSDESRDVVLDFPDRSGNISPRATEVSRSAGEIILEAEERACESSIPMTLRIIGLTIAENNEATGIPPADIVPLPKSEKKKRKEIRGVLRTGFIFTTNHTLRIHRGCQMLVRELLSCNMNLPWRLTAHIAADIPARAPGLVQEPITAAGIM
ncbi:hypothetical protein PR048_013839 [Dryococelus australis]|uniref:Nuclear receptor domain-containing protein n=1 Tax=Dryococelus australis TaxID=614101 RepID=A0ABQ9HTB9_9NEOP|nr:hypothetical protein PR048_013839 [Dryococelus australis]